MRRTGQRPIASSTCSRLRARVCGVPLLLGVVVIVIALLFLPRTAHAFHAGNMFDKAPGAGGGGGVFYVGAPKRDKGWNCIACHRDPEGKIRVVLVSDPPGLFETFRYELGKTYALEAKLEGEHRGANAGGSNFNGIAVSILRKDDGSAAGEISGYAADVFYGSGPTTIASAGQRSGENRWTFQWTAPTTSVGIVTIHLGAVDGNGAEGAGGSQTLTDPWGDDVYVGALAIDPPPGTPTGSANRKRQPSVTVATTWSWGWSRTNAVTFASMLGMALALWRSQEKTARTAREKKKMRGDDR